MKEFDFDELDRAVTNLMGSVPDEKADTPSTKESTNGTSTTSDATSKPVAAPNQPSAPTPAPTSKAVPASTNIAPRRSGRFMDVMHPSADMTNDKSRPTNARPSRQGTTLAPLGGSSISETIEQPQQSTTAQDLTSFTPESVVEPKAPVASVTTDENTDTASEWPDPIDHMATAQTTVDTEPTIDTEPSTSVETAPTETTTAKESNEKNEATESTSAPSLTSPFLTDAKVEKRPLGGAVSSNEPAQALDINPDSITPMPAELDGKLMAIESGEDAIVPATTPAPASETAPAPSVPEKSPTKPVEQEPVAAASTTNAAEIVKPAATSTGPVAIQPQYKEEPSTGDAKNGAIFDTDTYHKPLAHPAKKKSGWLWLLLIVLLIALGGGLGAAAYFMGLFSYL